MIVIAPLARHPRLYGIDIETDTTVDGLDPRVARVIAVAVVSASQEWVIAHHSEPALLARVDRLLAGLDPGVLVTWNGAAFDLPFLADRAARTGTHLGLRLAESPEPTRRRGDEVRIAYRAAWHTHTHLDAYRVWRADLTRHVRMSCSLKAVAGLVGLDAVRVDASRIHDQPADVVRRYVASDARLARQLALARWDNALGYIDAPVATDTTLESTAQLAS